MRPSRSPRTNCTSTTRIGIVLRKLGKFDVGEKYFMRAVNYAKDDPKSLLQFGPALH